MWRFTRSPQYPGLVWAAKKKYNFFFAGGFAPRTPTPGRPHSRPPKVWPLAGCPLKKKSKLFYCTIFAITNFFFNYISHVPGNSQIESPHNYLDSIQKNPRNSQIESLLQQKTSCKDLELSFGSDSIFIQQFPGNAGIESPQNALILFRHSLGIVE